MGPHRGSERRNVTRAAKPPCRTFSQAVTRSSRPLPFGRGLRGRPTTRTGEGSGRPLTRLCLLDLQRRPLPRRGEGTVCGFFFAERDRSIEPGARSRSTQAHRRITDNLCGDHLAVCRYRALIEAGRRVVRVMQMDSKRVTIELPIGGSGEDYAGAIALAIANANCTGDKRGAAALIGLMSKIKLPAGHNAQIELGPWVAAL